MSADIIFKEESYKIIGACFAVHRKLGPGFLESVYSEALEIELIQNDIPFEKEKKLQLRYDDTILKKYFKVDFICYNVILLELKSAKFLSETDVRQVLNYLKATKIRLALLINFGSKSLTYKRILN